MGFLADINAKASATEQNARTAVDRYAQKAPSMNQTNAIAGRQNADLWQSHGQATRQNAKGVSNPTNAANRGAALGQAFSVMDASAGGKGGMEHNDRLARVSDAGLGLRGMAQNAAYVADSNAIDRDKEDLNKWGWDDTLSQAINWGMTTYNLGSSLGGPKKAPLEQRLNTPGPSANVGEHGMGFNTATGKSHLDLTPADIKERIEFNLANNVRY